MLVDYWILPFALLLLWFPRQWLRLGKKVIRSSAPRTPGQPVVERDVRDASISLKSEITKARNWVDLARAAAGAVTVNYACFAVEPGAAKSVAPTVFALKGVLLLIAVLVQSIRLESRVRLMAPIFFILGLSFGLIGWQPALFAFVTVWTCNGAIPTAGVFLFAAASFQVVFGMLLARGLFTSQLLSAALAVVPLLLSGMLKRPLVRLNKSSRRNHR
jgi:hypothetical protein